MGPVKLDAKTPPAVPKVHGYERQGDTVVFKCPDRTCDFAQGLPIFVIDEDIYDVRPTLIIGTVDKFAMLAWRPEARALFGLAPNGIRESSPPGLIIQDELHLISGPLGSMVGLYEALIEELCTDRRNGAIPPKARDFNRHNQAVCKTRSGIFMAAMMWLCFRLRVSALQIPSSRSTPGYPMVPSRQAEFTSVFTLQDSGLSKPLKFVHSLPCFKPH